MGGDCLHISGAPNPDARFLMYVRGPVNRVATSCLYRTNVHKVRDMVNATRSARLMMGYESARSCREGASKEDECWGERMVFAYETIDRLLINAVNRRLMNVIINYNN